MHPDVGGWQPDQFLQLLNLGAHRERAASPSPMGRRHPTLLGLLGFVLLIAGCATSPGGTDPNSPASVAGAGVVDRGPDEANPNQVGPHAVPAEFIESVLADEDVTFEEFVLAKQYMYRCMVEGGLEGSVAFDPTLNLGLMEVYHPLDNDFDNPTDHATPVILGCEGSIDPITAVYARDNPETPEHRERQRQAILACVRREIPEVYRDLSEDWDLDTLRLWLYDLSPEEYDIADVVAASDCVNSGGAPWVSLRKAAGLED